MGTAMHFGLTQRRGVGMIRSMGAIGERGGRPEGFEIEANCGSSFAARRASVSALIPWLVWLRRCPIGLRCWVRQSQSCCEITCFPVVVAAGPVVDHC